MFDNGLSICFTKISNIDKHSKRPSRRWRQSLKFSTVISNFVKVEDIQLAGKKSKRRTGKLRTEKKQQKFNSINRLHEDIIDLKIFDRASDYAITGST